MAYYTADEMNDVLNQNLNIEANFIVEDFNYDQ